MRTSTQTTKRPTRAVRALRRALFELIEEKPYGEITVQEVLERADVARSTFYAHFRDKEDLFRGDWERFLDHFVGRIQFDDLEGAVFPMEEFLRHVAQSHSLYRSLVRSGRLEQLLRLGREHVADAIERKLESGGAAPVAAPAALLANLLSSEIFAMLRWWLDQNMLHSPEEMARVFHRHVAGAIKSHLAAGTEGSE